MTRLPRITWIRPVWQPDAMNDILVKLSHKRKALSEQELLPDMRQRNVRMCPTPSRTADTVQKACNLRPEGGGGSDPDNTTASTTTADTGNNNREMDAEVNTVEKETTTKKEASTAADLASRTTITDSDGRQSDNQHVGYGTATGEYTTNNGAQGRANGRNASRQGPCVFGCTTTTNINKEVQVWRNPPKPSPWPNVWPDASLCNKCYFRGMTLRKKGIEEASRGRNRAANATSTNHCNNNEANASTHGDAQRDTCNPKDNNSHRTWPDPGTSGLGDTDFPRVTKIGQDYKGKRFPTDGKMVTRTSQDTRMPTGASEVSGGDGYGKCYESLLDPDNNNGNMHHSKDIVDVNFTTGYMATTGCTKDRFQGLRCGCASCEVRVAHVGSEQGTRKNDHPPSSECQRLQQCVG